MEDVKQRGIWILKFRDFTIKDIRLGVRSRTALKSALKFFTENGYITPLLPSGELPFLRQLVASHPENKRGFEHFLLSTRPGIMPSEVLEHLKKRSTEYIPTLAAVYLYTPAGPDPATWNVMDVRKLVETQDLSDLQKEIKEDSDFAPRD